MRIVHIAIEDGDDVRQEIYVDGELFMEAEQPVSGFFGRKGGTEDIVSLVTKAFELAQQVEEAKTNGEEVTFDSFAKRNGKLVVLKRSRNELTEEEGDFLADCFDCAFIDLVDELIYWGYTMDWFGQNVEAVVSLTEEVDSINEAIETNSEPVSVDENKPIDVPLTPEPVSTSHYTPSYQADENKAYESAHHYDAGPSHSSHDSHSSSYDSGGSSDCGSSDGGGCGGD